MDIQKRAKVLIQAMPRVLEMEANLDNVEKTMQTVWKETRNTAEQPFQKKELEENRAILKAYKEYVMDGSKEKQQKPTFSAPPIPGMTNTEIKVNGGNNTGKAYNGDHIRVYATDTPAGTLTITLAEGYELVSVKVSAQTGTYAFLSVNDIKDVCNKTVGIYGNSVVLKTVKNGDNGKQVRVTAIEVVYQAK